MKLSSPANYRWRFMGKLTVEGTRRDLTLVELSVRALSDFRLACNELFFGFGCLECCLRTCDLRTILGGLCTGGDSGMGAGSGSGSGSGVRGKVFGISIFCGVFTGETAGDGDKTGE